MIQRTVLNMIPNGIEPVVHISQYDTEMRTLEFELVDDQMQPFSIPAGSKVEIRGTKPDDKGFIYDCTFKANIVTQPVKEQMSVIAGYAKCELRVTNNGQVISSKKFILDVEASSITDDTKVSNSDIASVEELIQRAETGGISSADVDKAVSNYLQKNPIQAYDDAEVKREINELSERIGNASHGGGTVYNAKDYGLVSGAENSTPTLQALINKVHDAGGGTIFVPNGTYTLKVAGTVKANKTSSTDIDYAIELKSNVSIIGEDKEKVIFKASVESNTLYPLFWNLNVRDSLDEARNNPLTGCTYSNFTCDGYDMTGPAYTTAGKAFLAEYCKNCEWTDLILNGFPSTALGVDMLDNCLIDHCFIYEAGRMFDPANGTHVYASGGAGIGIGTGGGWGNEGFMVTNCIAEKCGNFGIFVEHLSGPYTYLAEGKGPIISNCIARNNRRQGFSIRGGENVIIDSCQAYDNAQDGFYIYRPVKNVKITGCISSGNGRDGLYDEGEDARHTHENVVITDSSFLNNAHHGVEFFVNTDVVFKKGVVQNCYFDGNDCGIVITSKNKGKDGQQEGFTFKDNIIKNSTRYGIYLKMDGTDLTVEGNITLGSGSNGLIIDSGIVLANAIITNNVFADGYVNVGTFQGDTSSNDILDPYVRKSQVGSTGSGASTGTLTNPIKFAKYNYADGEYSVRRDSFDGSQELQNGTDANPIMLKAATEQMIKEAGLGGSGGGKEWVKILDQPMTSVNEVNAVEFDLSTNEEHDEYYFQLEIDKDTGGHENTNTNHNIRINGMLIGYYFLSYNASMLYKYLDVYVSKKPVPEAVRMYDGPNNPVYNAYSTLRSRIDEKETGTGKFKLEFPNGYTGKVKVVVYAR